MIELRTPAAMQRVAAVAALAVAALAATACEPCAGVASCHGSAQLSYSGRVIEFVSGTGTPSTTVVFHRASGVTINADSVVATTDGEGRYTLRAEAGSVGEVVGSVSVRPPAPRLAYVVPDVHLTTSDVRGAGGVLPTWLAQPFVSFVGSVVSRRTGQSTASASTVFIRRSGARLVRDTIVAGTDLTGFFYLQAAALEAGDVVGDLVVSGAALARPYTISGVRLTASYVDRLPKANATWRIGTSLDYAFLIRYRGLATPVTGATVEFRRTGGARLVSDVVSGTTDSIGRVAIRPSPATEDTTPVVGDLTVTAPGLRRPYVVRGVRFQAFDSEDLRFGGVINVGYAVVAAADLAFRGDRSPLAGADVQFVRTGGLAASPSTISVRTLSDGRFGLVATTDTIGDVVGDLIVSSGLTSAPTRIAGVRLLARDDDSVRYAGRYAIGSQLLYNGILTQRGSTADAAGWTVIFRRTGGIRLVADTLVSQTLDWGGFGLAPSTREEGVVDGTLEARPPGGGPTVSLGTVHLQTYADDSVRLAGRWSVGPSLLYVGELRRADNNAVVVGALAEFRPTGGIPVAETVVGERTNAEGRFRIAPTPLASGEVIGDLHIVPPAPLRDTTIVGVRLRTFESDEVRLGGVWRLVP